MSYSKTLRRRLHHGDVDRRKREHFDTPSSDSLSEPLLGNNREYDDRHPEQYTLNDLLEDEGMKVQLHWSFVFTQLLAHWAQWLANIVVGSKSLLGRFVNFPTTHQTKLLAPSLSPLQEERLRNLQSRLKVPFDGSQVEHQDALKRLWRLAFPTRELPPLKSELWKEMGWQGTDPSTDFRGGGYISLENLIFFAEKYPESFQCLLHKLNGKRADWEYPFAVAGINISFMLAQMLDLQSGSEIWVACDTPSRRTYRGFEGFFDSISGGPTSMAAVRFQELLAVDEMAFDNLFCIAFQMLDAQWLAKRASYMEFNEVLKSTRAQLERELELEDISSVKDLPAYNLLRR